MTPDDPRLAGQLLQTRLVTALVLFAAIGFMLYLVATTLAPTFERITAAFTAAQEIAHHD